jgi:hypothetical protein
MVNQPAADIPGHFVGTVKVQAGGFLPLTPDVLSMLDIKGGDYVYLKAEKDRLELRKLALRPAHAGAQADKTAAPCRSRLVPDPQENNYFFSLPLPASSSSSSSSS